MNVTKERLDNNFLYHEPFGDQLERYGKIRKLLREVAEAYVTLTPASREQSLALTSLEESGFWANAAIARNEINELQAKEAEQKDSSQV